MNRSLNKAVQSTLGLNYEAVVGDYKRDE